MWRWLQKIKARVEYDTCFSLSYRYRMAPNYPSICAITCRMYSRYLVLTLNNQAANFVWKTLLVLIKSAHSGPVQEQVFNGTKKLGNDSFITFIQIHHNTVCPPGNIPDSVSGSMERPFLILNTRADTGYARCYLFLLWILLLECRPLGRGYQTPLESTAPCHLALRYSVSPSRRG